jgi:serine/threonine-protein kinase
VPLESSSGRTAEITRLKCVAGIGNNDRVLMFCPQCGAQQSVASDVCPECGAFLAPIRQILTNTRVVAPVTSQQAQASASTVTTGKSADVAADSAGRPPNAHLSVGQRFGNRYEIIRLLGIGDTGAVYQAWDSELEVAVAFKVVRPAAVDDPAVAEAVERRFKRESMLARQLTHPNVVRIDDVGAMGGITYIARPYIEGRNLGELLADVGTLPIQRALLLARQIVSGLCAAHEAGIVHRHLKPSNILIDAADRALIVDFGIGRTDGPPADCSSSSSATLEYMAPEQARDGEADHRADIYAFGLILRRMLVNRPDQDATIPGAVHEILSKCLQSNPDERYTTSQELRAALDRLDENGVRLPDPRPLWQRPRFWASAAAATAALAAMAWWFAR